MIRTFIKSVLVAFIVYSGSAVAAIIPFTQSSVSPSVVSFGATGPNPFLAGGSPVQNHFAVGEGVRISTMIDLQALDQTTDESAGNPLTLQWETEWYDSPLAAAPIYGSFYEVAWSDIAAWKASGFEALSFVTNVFAPATTGNWEAASFFEFSNYSGSAFFDVPEPSTLFLLGLGLAGVVVRKKRIAA